MKWSQRNKNKALLLGIVMWSIGALLTIPISVESIAPKRSASPAAVERKVDSSEYSKNFGLIHFKESVFFTILVNNFVVALLISVGGFLTAGLLTSIVFIWNGFMLAMMVRTVNELFSKGVIKFFLFHGIFEISSFLIFGIIGFGGFTFWRTVVNESKVPLEHIPHWRSFIVPSTLLVIAAGIEYYLIQSHTK